MKDFKLRTTILALLASLAVAWVLAPTAAAQTTLDLSLDGQFNNMVPESDPRTLTATVTYAYSQQALSPSFAASSSVPLSFTPDCPPSILIVGPTTKNLQLGAPSPNAPAQGGTAEATFTVTATRETPGLKSLECTLTVSATPSAPVTAPNDASEKFLVSADYYALVQPKITKKLQQAGPQKQVPFAIELTNFGNARTQVSFEVGNAPSGKRWDVLLPDNLILDSPYGGGEGKTVDTATVTVATPYKNGWNNEQGAYQINMKVASADQPEDNEGNPVSANILVRVRGVYVPGLEPFVLVAAVLGSALVLRMRKAE